MSLRGALRTAFVAATLATAASAVAQPPARPSVLSTLNATADAYAARGDHARALVYYQQALEIRERTLPPDDPAIAESLDKLASTHRAMQNHARALPLVERSLEIRERAFSPDHPAVAMTLNKLAETYFSLRQYEQALALQHRTLAIYDRSTPRQPELIAITCINSAVTHLKLDQHAQAQSFRERALDVIDRLSPVTQARLTAFVDRLAIAYADLGRHGDALPLMLRALATVEQATSTEDSDIAARLIAVANTYSKLGQYERALVAAQRASQIQTRVLPPDHSDIAAGLGQLATVHAQLGQYEQALILRRRVLELREASLPPNDPNLATALNNLAATYQDLGDYSDARRLFERVLTLREQALPANDDSTAIALNNLASAHTDLSEFARALFLYERALRLVEATRPANHPDRAVFLSNLASLYATLGRHELARDMAERALALREQSLPADHPDIARSLFVLANIHERAGNYSSAFSLHERVLSIREHALPPDHPDIAAAQYELAVSHAVLGRREQSLPLLRRSLEIRQRVLPSDHPSIAQSLATLGNHYVWLRAYDDAAPLLHRAIAIAQSNPAASDPLWVAQYWLGRLYAQTNRPDLAIVWSKEAVGTIQGVRGQLKRLDRELQAGFLTNYQFVYSELADQLVAAERIEEAQQVLQMLKEQELHDTLQRAAASDPRSTRLELTGLERNRFERYYELRDQQSSLAVERAALERKRLLGEISADEQQRLQALDRDLQSLREAMLVFLTELEKESAPLAQGEGRTETPPALAERNLQAALRVVRSNRSFEDAVAVQYVLTDARLSVLLTMPGAPVLARQIEIDADALRTLIVRTLERLRTPHSDLALFRQDLRQLYALLIAPIETDLRTARAKMLIVVPNGPLRYVPFAALMNGDRYLVQDYTLTMFNEAVKKSFASQTAEKWQPVAMGFTRSIEEENLPALVAARDEVRAVALKSGMPGRSYIDDEFTRAVLDRALGSSFNVLHLATHFKFTPGRPDASRLYLGDGTTLTLADIARERLRFDRFALVALSACESGVGGGLDADGRELESLGALVQNQGAHAVIATLWKINDNSTAEWMKQFYKHRVIRRLSKAQALRTAQLSFIEAPRGRNPSRTHPYYWAPFLLMGDWR